MVYEDFFGPWGRIILVTVGALAFLLGILLIACFVTPGCIGYECVRPRRKVVKPMPSPFKRAPNENMKLSDVSYRSWRLGSLYHNGNGTISENAESHRDSFRSTDAQFEAVDTSSTLNLVQPVDKQKNENKKDFPTELTLSLRYLPPCEGIVTGKLVIGIEALSGLPPKQYNCTLEPYVAFDVVKHSWSSRKRQKLYSFKTKGIRHTASPIYRESFVISDVKPQEIKEWFLHIVAHDHDRYANHTELCTLQVSLKDAKKIFITPETHLFNFRMKQSNQTYGNILMGISYLPTAQRLTINIMKLRDLKFTHVVSGVNEFNPYVRVFMLNGKTGKRIKKKKTKFMIATAQPEFNETLTFDLPVNQLDNLQFLVVLCSKLSYEEKESPGMNEVQSDSEDSVNSWRKPKDICIGKVALGKGVRGPTERLHWFSVLQNPRNLVTVWHTLK